ncbi:hypothetical protein AGMMS4956_16300 [Bacteroidia bacterium]|nr:hypothetical protein AGMMS4956_16300 [Bacteroidia bacterium]
MKKTFLNWLTVTAAAAVVAFNACNPNEKSKSEWKILTVIFDGQGGDSVVAPQEVLSGYKANRPYPDITKGDSVLEGWFTDPAKTTLYDFATPVTENMTLYAKWKHQGNIWIVNFNSQGGSAVTHQEIEKGSGGSAVLPEPYPTKENASFGGWYTDETFTQRFDFATAVNRNYTLHARWVRAGMMYVQGGTFTMGRNEDNSVTNSSATTPVSPAHQVTVSDFIIGIYEVTNAEFVAFFNDKSVPSNGILDGNAMFFDNGQQGYTHNGTQWAVKSGLDEYPAKNLSWRGALAYCEWAGGRLPSEAEWEFAALGGNKTQGYTYIGGETPDELGWFGAVHAKGQKTPNELDLYDMAGNLWEWCWDGAAAFSAEPQTNPFGPDTYPDITWEWGRIVKGGVWITTNAIRPYTRDFVGVTGDNFTGVRLLIP